VQLVALVWELEDLAFRGAWDTRPRPPARIRRRNRRGCLVPIVLFAVPLAPESDHIVPGRYSVVSGFVLNRLNVGITARAGHRGTLPRAGWKSQSPGIVAIGFALFGVACRILPISSAQGRSGGCDAALRHATGLAQA
jgi:hypothetical protein